MEPLRNSAAAAGTQSEMNNFNNLVAQGIVKVVLFSTGLLLAARTQSQPSSTLTDFWSVDGPVHTIAETNGIVYLGGAFSYAGPASGGAGVISLGSGEVEKTFPRVEGVVRTALSDGNGGWYLGGTFTKVGRVARSNLVHILSNNAVDETWNPNMGDFSDQHYYWKPSYFHR